MIDWEYKERFDYKEKLEEKTNKIYLQFLFNTIKKDDIVESILDTRSIHKFLFRELTPPRCEYLAGNYRGDNYKHLKDMEIGVGNDRGIPPDLVKQAMNKFGLNLKKGLCELDKLHQNPNKLEPEKSKRTVVFACEIFILFLRIHPYANGNGHIARYILIAILKTYGYEITHFPLDPRPNEPQYSQYIKEYIAGNKTPLVKWIFEKIKLK